MAIWTGGLQPSAMDRQWTGVVADRLRSVGHTSTIILVVYPTLAMLPAAASEALH
jgi:hypothetical protein